MSLLNKCDPPPIGYSNGSGSGSGGNGGSVGVGGSSSGENTMAAVLDISQRELYIQSYHTPGKCSVV